VSFDASSFSFWTPKLTSTCHPQSNGGQEKFNKTLIESLCTYVSQRQDSWDKCVLFFVFAYNNSVNPSTGYPPFILSYAQSPRAPWQFLDAMLPDDVPLVDASHPTKLSGTQLASSLGLDIINNVCETSDFLDHMVIEFRVRNSHLVKPHSYKVGDGVLFSTRNGQLNLPCTKLSPTYVGPFTIRSLLGDNSVINLFTWTLRTGFVFWTHTSVLPIFDRIDFAHPILVLLHRVFPLNLCRWILTLVDGTR
jgi:hypothetical protein